MTEIAPHRVGRPSPLVTHLSAATIAYHGAITMASLEGRAKINWQSELSERGNSIGDLDQLRLYQSAGSRLQQFLSGLEKWQRHSYRRTVLDPPVIWSDGSSRLLDFGATNEASTPNGPPILIVPSLINHAYILDLKQDCSLLRFLASQGLRPLLLDWGTPSDAERTFDLNSYTTQRFMPALEVAKSLSSNSVGVLGYCMGGTLAAGVLAQSGAGVGAFATIGSPWDFDQNKGMTAALQLIAKDRNATDTLENIGAIFGMIPADLFQHLFALINPMQAAVKFRKFDEMDQNSASAKHFVAIEDWLADAIPLPTPTAQDLLVGWSLHNKPARRKWKCLSAKVDLRTIHQPTLHICGKRDSITQLDVALSMASDIPNAKTIQSDTGHIGMIVGSQARETVWEPGSKFFNLHLN